MNTLASPWALVRMTRDWLARPAGRRTQQAASLLLSVMILGLLARALADIGWQRLTDVLPGHPLFWLLFGANYLSQPFADWLIYRRWWGLGTRDLGVFLKKHVLNEALFAYAGDGWLMGWAVRRLGLQLDPAHPPQVLGRGDGQGLDPAANPFAAVKDVAITSGLAGNLFTLGMLVLTIGFGAFAALETAVDADTLVQGATGFALLLTLNLLILFNRDMVFSLCVQDNLRSFALHFVRVSVGHGLMVASWVVALPMVGLEAWLLLGALRLVISRLPVPNKQLLFAAVAVEVAGEAAPAVAALMAAQGVLTLAGHVSSWFVAQALLRRE